MFTLDIPLRLLVHCTQWPASSLTELQCVYHSLAIANINHYLDFLDSSSEASPPTVLKLYLLHLRINRKTVVSHTFYPLLLPLQISLLFAFTFGNIAIVWCLNMPCVLTESIRMNMASSS